jgi:hypothetical protein
MNHYKSKQGHCTHTCTLRIARKLNIPKIAKASYQNKIKAYKNK